MSEPTESEDERAIPVKYRFPPHVEGRTGSQAMIQFTADNFIVSFFEDFPPVLVGSIEEKRAQLKELEHVELRCVARIRMTSSEFRKLVKTGEGLLAEFDKQAAAGAKEKGVVQ